MTYKEILDKKTFVVVGDTVNPDKYAYKIKQALLENGYDVHAVGKELDSILDVPTPFDVLDLCINPAKGIHLLREAISIIPFVLIQPGAGSEEIEEFLDSNSIPYLNGCVLMALRERDL